MSLVILHKSLKRFLYLYVDSKMFSTWTSAVEAEKAFPTPGKKSGLQNKNFLTTWSEQFNSDP